MTGGLAASTKESVGPDHPAMTASKRVVEAQWPEE